jgi:hypothetical protein
MTETLLLVICYCAIALFARLPAGAPFPSSAFDLALIGIGVFHVAPEALRVILDLPPGPYRAGLPEQATSSWLAVVSASIVLFGLGPQLVGRRSIPPRSRASLVARRVDGIDRIFVALLVLAAIVLGGMTVAGRAFGGYDSDNYLAGSIGSAASVPAMISLAVLAVLRGRLPVITLLIVAIVLFLMGSRSVVGWSLLAGTVLVRRCGGTVPTRRLILLTLLGTSMIISIALIRELAGRWTPDARLGDRAEAVSRARASSAETIDWRTLIEEQFVHRIDGNGYGMSILNAQERLGITPMGLSAISSSFRLATPSFLWPRKLDMALESRNQELASIDHHRIDELDYLPTVLGSAVSIFGWAGAPLIAGVLGIVVALADRSMEIRRPWHLPIAASFLLAVLYFEGNIESAILGCRTIAVVATLAFAGWITAHMICFSARVATVRRLDSRRDARVVVKHTGLPTPNP